MATVIHGNFASRLKRGWNPYDPAKLRDRGLEPVAVEESTVRKRGTWLIVAAVGAFFVWSVTAPIDAGSNMAGNATVRRSFEERRLVEERARTELERLHALVDGGRQALAINAKAIAAAELSVEANSRSYEGGVRTNVDVVNAIQTVFEVKNAYVQAATTLATNYLNLQLLAGVDPEDALATTQAFLLAR